MKKYLCLFTPVILILLSTIAYAQNTDQNLILHFSFDEGEGNTTANVSSNKLEGTITNANWVDGVVGQALQFDEGALAVPLFGVDGPEEMTIEFWFKPIERIVYGKRIDLIYRLNGAGRPHITFNHAGVDFGCYLGTRNSEFVLQSSYTAFYPQWYYFVLTQDQDKAVLYIDGEIDNEISTGGPVRMDLVKNGLSIGGHIERKKFFDGSIDEVKIWNIALTAEEIKNTWNKHTKNKQLLTSVHPNGVSKENHSKEFNAQQEKKNIEICRHNLQEIGKAIQAYHKEHGDYPEWLSDLLVEHLNDENLLICPADKNGGKALYVRSQDPNKPVSYGYDLLPAQREQMLAERTMYGDVVPIVRCMHHHKKGTYEPTISLSFGYEVYQSDYFWKNSLASIYGSVDDAIAALEDGLQKMPNNSRFFSVYPTLLKLYVKAERVDDAEILIESYKTVIDSKNVYHNGYLGDMLKEMNRHDEELQLYEDLEVKMPKNRIVLQRLENIHKQRGNEELAVEYQKKYVPGLAFLGEMVPDFEATDLEGEPISIEAYRGKVVLVDFWAVWCGPCVAEMPNVKRINEKYKDNGFDIIGISLDRDEKRLRDFLEENDIPWRQVFSGEGWNSPVSQQYGIYAIPTMWLIDKEGKLIDHKARGEKLEKLVAEALKEVPAE